MTEISNVKGTAQVMDLKPAKARAPDEVGGIDRFKGAERTASGEAGPAQSTKSTNLEKGQDPVEKVAQTIQEYFTNTSPNTKLRIDKDDDTGRFIYKSVDAESGEVIRQFPPETILQIISKFRDPEGLVLDNEA